MKLGGAIYVMNHFDLKFSSLSVQLHLCKLNKGRETELAANRRLALLVFFSFFLR